jgi:hypothetical protein
VPRGLEIDHAEYVGLNEHASPRYSIDLTSGGKCTRRFKIAWDDQYEADKELLGYSWADSGGLHRRLPARHPKRTWLVATNISEIVGLGKYSMEDTDDGVIATYPEALLTVEYTRPMVDYFDDDEIETEFDRYTTASGTLDGSYLTVPSFGTLKFTEGPNAGRSFPGNVGKIIPAGNYAFTWHQIPYEALPLQTIIDSLGKVNSTQFGSQYLPLLQFPAGSMLFLGGQAILGMQPGGTFAWDVEYHMQHDRKEHNKFLDFRANPQAFYFVTNTGTHYASGSIPDGSAVYDETDLNELWVVTPP